MGTVELLGTCFFCFVTVSTCPCSCRLLSRILHTLFKSRAACCLQSAHILPLPTSLAMSLAMTVECQVSGLHFVTPALSGLHQYIHTLVPFSQSPTH